MSKNRSYQQRRSRNPLLTWGWGQRWAWVNGVAKRALGAVFLPAAPAPCPKTGLISKEEAETRCSPGDGARGGRGSMESLSEPSEPFFFPLLRRHVQKPVLSAKKKPKPAAHLGMGPEVGVGQWSR